jgi:hypothetical protein
VNPNYNKDNSFLDIDELLLGIQQKSTLESAKPDSGGMAGKVDNGTQGDSPDDSSRSTVGSTQGEHTMFLNLVGTSYSYYPRSNYTE